MSQNEILYTIAVRLRTGESPLPNRNMLRLFEILDKNFIKIDHRWVKEDFVTFEKLPTGIFLVRVTIGGDIWGEQTVTTGEVPYQEIDIAQERWRVSDLEFEKGVYPSLVGAALTIPIVPYILAYYLGSYRDKYKQLYNVTFMEFSNERWQEYINQDLTGITSRFPPHTSLIKLPKGLFAMIITYRNVEPKFVIVPPGENQMSIAYAKGPVGVVHPLKVNFRLGNSIAGTLASLLDKNDVQCADTLMSAFDARDLLRDKMKDHVSAAIGGYYLLKVNRQDLMYDWGQNLANWFPWMADGPIIYAWQLLKGQDGANNREEIIRHLLKAVHRGLPIFTEGLRLLYEGILLVTDYMKQQNERIPLELQRAKEKVKHYVQHVDWSQQYTTMINFLPRERSNEWIKGNAGNTAPVTTYESSNIK